MKNNYLLILKSLAFVITISMGFAANATLIGEWNFNGTLNEESGGPAAQISNASGLGATGYTFGFDDNLTLNLNGLVPLDTYTIDMNFSLDFNYESYQATIYQRILGFKGESGDNGLYATNQFFNFYEGQGAGTHVSIHAFSAGELMNLRLSRDGSTDILSAYLNGNHLWDYTDSNDEAVFNSGAQDLVLFRYDYEEEGAAGFVDSIQVYDDAIGVAAVPVPAAVWLFGSALMGLVGLRKKKV